VRGDNDSTKVKTAQESFVDIDVAHRQTAMIVAVRLEEFKIPRVICHGHLAAKLRRPGWRYVQRCGERALETERRASTRHADIDDLASGIGNLIDTEVSGQLRNVFWGQRYPGLVETDWHGVCSSEMALSIFTANARRTPPSNATPLPPWLTVAAAPSTVHGDTILYHTFQYCAYLRIFLFCIYMGFQAPQAERVPDKRIGIAAHCSGIDHQQIDVAGDRLSAPGIRAKE
jgi:hypothetical protein